MGTPAAVPSDGVGRAQLAAAGISGAAEAGAAAAGAAAVEFPAAGADNFVIASLTAAVILSVLCFAMGFAIAGTLLKSASDKP